MVGRLDDLSAAEVQCLLLVAEGVTTSKAIAERTRLAPGTIDTYLSRAAKTLGVGSRRDAAARYLELVATSERNPGEPEAPSQSRSQSRSERVVEAEPVRSEGGAAAVRWLFTVPPIGGPEHSLTWIEKTLAILRIAAVSLSIVILIVMAGAGVLWVTE